MFKPEATYFTVLRISDPIVARKFSKLSFVESIDLVYPTAEDESIVMRAFFEVLDKIQSIDGVQTIRTANALHYTYDGDADELDPCIIEKHSIMYNDEHAGTLSVCAEGAVFSTSHVLQ